MEIQRKIYKPDELTPYEPTHPGEILKDELAARNLTQKKFADMLGMQYTILNEIVNGKRPISTDCAIILEAALGIEALFWIDLQTRYNIQKARKDVKLLARIQKIRRICASVL